MHDEGHACPHKDGQVASQPSKGKGEISIQGLLDDSSDLSPEHRTQQLDYHDQTATEDHQGDSKQDDAHSKVWETEVHAYASLVAGIVPMCFLLLLLTAGLAQDGLYSSLQSLLLCEGLI